MAVSRGEVRAYLYFGEMIGWLLYYETVGALLLRLQSRVFRLLRRIARKISVSFHRAGEKISMRIPGRRLKSAKTGKRRISRKKR